jgi:hypothetical protein
MYEENTTEMIEALAKDLRKVSSHNFTVELIPFSAPLYLLVLNMSNNCEICT